MPNYFWTKVWGRPSEPATDALLFNSEAGRDVALERLAPRDITVYLTSDATHADPHMKGRVSGAVEIDGQKVLAEDLGILNRARPVDFREDGRFRWPFGITIRRAWRVVDNESNDNLIPNHRDFRMQGAATIHAMVPDEVQKFLLLRVQEVSDAESVAWDPVPFSTSLKRPWKQKGGQRASSLVTPGTELYVAVIHDAFGTTFKIGSGKTEERLAQMNAYRRGSLKEPLWSVLLRWEFATVDEARDAEDQMIAAVHRRGRSLPDHSELAHGITFNEIKALFNEVVANDAA